MGSGEETTRRSHAEPPEAAVDGTDAEDATLLGPLGRGDRLGRYLVLERIGHGGMGSVYLALDASLERKVAIKVLHPGIVAAAEERRVDQAVATLREGIRQGRTMAGSGASGDSRLLVDELSRADALLATLLPK